MNTLTLDHGMTAVLFLNHRVEVLDRRLGNSESIFLQLMAGAPEWGFPLSWQDPGKSILFFPFSLDPQLPVIADHVFKAVVGVQAARAWQDPDGCTSQFFFLPACGSARPVEGEPVGLYAEEGYMARAEFTHLQGELLSAFDELSPAQLSGAGGGPLHEVRDAVSHVKEFMFLEGGEKAPCEACCKQDPPEPVSRPGKVMPCGP